MATIRLKHVNTFIDRHGKARRYFRRRGLRPVPLPGLPGSIEFMQAYEAALAGAAPVASAARLTHAVGTFSRLVADYRGSAKYQNLAPKSQQTYDKVLGGLVEKYGHQSVAGLTPQVARRIIERIGAERPAMANVTAAVLHVVMAYAVKAGLRYDNPVVGIERYKIGEHHTWTEAELAAFEARWPLGTRERLIFDLLLWTDQRIGDVAKMSRAHIKGDEIKMKQQKTGKEMTITIAPELAASIAAVKANGLPLIAAKSGRALDVGTISDIMVEAAAKAGLPKKCVPHGLRKAMLARLSLLGATTKQLQAVSGQASLKEVERYTRAADQAALNRSAMALLARRST